MNDLISRQDAINAMYRLEMEDVETYGCSIPEGFDAKSAVEALEALPSAEPEQKKGEWVGDCCSCCGVSKYNYIKMVDDECGPFGTWNFCPHCGARLEWNDDE